MKIRQFVQKVITGWGSSYIGVAKKPGMLFSLDTDKFVTVFVQLRQYLRELVPRIFACSDRHLPFIATAQLFSLAGCSVQTSVA
jgi:hypothetical protein